MAFHHLPFASRDLRATGRDVAGAAFDDDAVELEDGPVPTFHLAAEHRAASSGAARVTGGAGIPAT